MSAYDLDALRRGLVSIEDNIQALEDALVIEREKKAEYEREIIGAEAILAVHKRGLPPYDGAR
jgi:hypothetical protein